MRAPLGRCALALAALLLGACAADDARPAAPAPRAAAPSTPSAEPAAAPAPAAPSPQAAPAAAKPARPVSDFQWPDPLPPAAVGVPTLFKGMIIGSWTPEGEAGFDHEWVDERGLREAWTKTGASRRMWKGFQVGSPTVSADALLDDREGPAVGYVFSLVARSHGDPAVEDAPAVLHVRHRGRVRVFVDGMPTIDAAAPAAGAWAEERKPIVLSGPYTVLLLKLGRGSAELGSSMDVEVRVSNPDGSALPDQSWNTMRPPRDPGG